MVKIKSRELKRIARKKIEGYTITYIIVVLLTTILSQLPIVSFLLLGAITLSFSTMSLKLLSDQGIEIDDAFNGFSNIVGAFFLMLKNMIYLLLWTILCFPIGIVKSFSYSMSFYILAENPEMKSKEVITRSRKMMNGYKMDLFCVYLSFIGWYIICFLTLGLAIYYVRPYMQVTIGAFYNKIKNVNTKY